MDTGVGGIGGGAAVNELSIDELSGIARVMSDAGVDLEGRLTATPLAGGRSNLTFRLDDGSSAWVLRMPPRHGRTPSAHDVGREFRVTSALMQTTVPVPPQVVMCDDERVVGFPFAIAGFVDGQCLRLRTDLDGLGKPAIDMLVSELVETLAALHAVDHVAVGLQHFGRPLGYAERQLRRWSVQWETVGGPDPDGVAAELIRRLGAALPEQRSVGIVHGDFRVDNTLLDPATGRVAAVLDWELSTIGDPVADVAMMCAYREPAFDFIVGEPAAWTSPDLPDADGLAALYERASGRPLHAWNFHLALAYFKIAVIAAGIDHRRLSGGVTGPGFDTSGDAVMRFLEAGLATLS